MRRKKREPHEMYCRHCGAWIYKGDMHRYDCPDRKKATLYYVTDAERKESDDG